MKKHQKLVIVALTGFLLILANGCIPSIHPIYTKDKLVTVNELPGTWLDAPNDVSFSKKQKVMGQEKEVDVTVYQQDEDRPEVWKFKAEGDKRYLLIHTDKSGYTAAFDVHVVKLGDHLFMDFFPTTMPESESKKGLGIGSLFDGEKMNGLREIHLYPVHNFAKLEVKQNQLTISMFDPEFLKNLLERQQIRIKHEKTEDGFILTASPEELQKFAQKYANLKEAFLEDPTVLSKKA